MQQSRTIVPFATPRPDRKAKRLPKGWKHLTHRASQYRVIQYVCA